MAQPIYDEEDREKDLNDLTPEALRKLEDKYSTPEDEAEDNAIEHGSDPDSTPKKGMGRKLREHSEQKDQEEQEALNERLRNAWGDAREKDLANLKKQGGKGWYTGAGGQSKWAQRIKKWRKRRAWWLAGGSLVAGMGVAGVLMFSFLNFYKLDSLISNIDEKSFARLNGSLDQRSDQYVAAYMKLRLADIGDDAKNIDTDNLIFRSNKVSTGNPIKDWYQTLRTSSFEKDVFGKQGIKFVSIAYRDGNQIKFRPAKITLDGKDYTGTTIPENTQNELRDALNTGDWSKINIDDFGSRYLQIDTFSNNKEARREIKQVVQDNTHFFQIFKRRQVRKAIQNMTGVTDWRFFDDARTKLDEKKINIRNRLIEKALPENTKSGKLIKCLFGISDCKYSADPSDPVNQADGSLKGGDTVDNNGQDVPTTDANGNPQAPTTVDLGPAADVIKSIVNKISTALDGLNAVSLLDTLSRFNKSLSNHELSKGVEVARGTQAMGVERALETARDQVKNGNANSAQYNALIGLLSSAANSDGWQKVINGQGDPGKPTDSAAEKFYCSEKAQTALEANPNLVNTDKRYAHSYQCPDKQVGGTSTAGKLEDAYSSSVGQVLGPILQAYGTIRNAPIIGSVVTWANGLINSLTSKLTDAFISAFGLQKDFQSLSIWLSTHVAAFLGAGPILTGSDPGGVIFNWALQGGAYTAEATTRAAGGIATTALTKVTAEQNLASYQADKNATMSNFDKYLSLSNPDSPAAKETMAISQTNFSTMFSNFSFGSIFKTISSAFTLPFNRQVHAQSTSTGYEASKFAAIDTTDIPSQCFKLDPVTETPLQNTNIIQVMAANGINIPEADITFDLLKDRNTWYQYIYDKLGDNPNADKIALTIYNCQLFDGDVRGNIGATHGYKDDGGLNDSNSSSSQSTQQSSNQPGQLPSGSAKDLATQLVKYLDNGSISCNGGQGSRCPDIRNTASGTSIKNSSCYVDKLDPTLLGMLLELAQQGHKFVLSAICTDHPSNPASYHHQGKAADFNYIDGVFMGPDDTPWTGSKLDAGKKLDQDAASFMPKGTGFGQETGRCHAHFDFLDPNKFTLFDDACNHQHVQVP